MTRFVHAFQLKVGVDTQGVVMQVFAVLRHTVYGRHSAENRAIAVLGSCISEEALG